MHEFIIQVDRMGERGYRKLTETVQSSTRSLHSFTYFESLATTRVNALFSSLSLAFSALILSICWNKWSMHNNKCTISRIFTQVYTTPDTLHKDVHLSLQQSIPSVVMWLTIIQWLTAQEQQVDNTSLELAGNLEETVSLSWISSPFVELREMFFHIAILI